MTIKPLDTPLYPRRNHAARRQDVARVLVAQPEASDRRIARIAAVSREMVREIRREMVRTSQIPSHHARYRVGADGKTYDLSPTTYRRVPKPKDLKNASDCPVDVPLKARLIDSSSRLEGRRSDHPE